MPTINGDIENILGVKADGWAQLWATSTYTLPGGETIIPDADRVPIKNGSFTAEANPGEARIRLVVGSADVTFDVSIPDVEEVSLSTLLEKVVEYKPEVLSAVQKLVEEAREIQSRLGSAEQLDGWVKQVGEDREQVASDAAAASGSAAAAKQSEVAAGELASAAAASESAAGESESKAAQSASAAASSEQSASSSAVQAGESASAAAESASQASESASAASGDAGRAEAAATRSESAAGKAEGHETASAQSAKSAQEASAAAVAARDEAVPAAAAAKESQESASASADTATAQASAAQESASTASKSDAMAAQSASAADASAQAAGVSQQLAASSEAVSGEAAQRATSEADRATSQAEAAAKSAEHAAETASSGIPDATTSSKGKVQLAGDLAGTADAPTVPKLAEKADLVQGKIPTTQIPAVALTKPQVVSDREGMTALEAQEGDIAVIAEGTDKGTYMLGHGEPSSFDSWVKLAVPDDVVSSVNGQIGVVQLSASDVGAAEAGHTHTSVDVVDAVNKLSADTGRKLVKAGDDGHLHDSVDPTLAAHLTRKAYVDKQVESVDSKIATTESTLGKRINARPALFSGAGNPPSTIPGAVVGDWWLDTTSMELSKITGV